VAVLLTDIFAYRAWKSLFFISIVTVNPLA